MPAVAVRQVAADRGRPGSENSSAGKRAKACQAAKTGSCARGIAGQVVAPPRGQWPGTRSSGAMIWSNPSSGYLFSSSCGQQVVGDPGARPVGGLLSLRGDAAHRAVFSRSWQARAERLGVRAAADRRAARTWRSEAAAEDAVERVVVVGRDRVELVVVAAGAGHRQAQQAAGHHVDAVVDDVVGHAEIPAAERQEAHRRLRRVGRRAAAWSAASWRRRNWS